jgi:anti-anti-sigma factor
MTQSTSKPCKPSRDGPPFSIGTTSLPNGTVRIEVRGELDIATAPRLNASLLRELVAGRDVELDLSGVAFMDASALGTIMGARKRFELREQAFLVSLQPSSQPHRLLTLTGILPMLVQADGADQPPTGND